MECSWEYVEEEVAESRQRVVLQLGGWARTQQPLIIKKTCYELHRALDSDTFLSVTRSEEHILRVFENRVLRGIFGPKREEMARGYGTLHNGEFYNLHAFTDVTKDQIHISLHRNIRRIILPSSELHHFTPMASHVTKLNIYRHPLPASCTSSVFASSAVRQMTKAPILHIIYVQSSTHRV
jgi:hypothetical protein